MMLDKNDLLKEIRGKLILIVLFVGVLFVSGLGEGVFNTKSIIATKSPEVGFTSVSPSGVSGGEIIPASCESGDYHDAPNFGRVCLASNVCGQSRQGTIVCGGGCSVTAPALPLGYGVSCQSSANSCGQKANGIIGCTGLCTAVTPSDLNCTTCPAPKGNGVCDLKENYLNCPVDCPPPPVTVPLGTIGSCSVDSRCVGEETAFSCPADCSSTWVPATGWTLTASPNPIFSNTRTTVSWFVRGATECTLVGVGVYNKKESDRYKGGAVYDYQTSKLLENTDFTLTCLNAYTNRKDSETIRVNVRAINIREF